MKTETDEKVAFLERLRAWTGVDSPQIRVGLDPVNAAMIRHWCEAVGDQNPVYTDPEQAARTVHGGIVAPPTMLGAWIVTIPSAAVIGWVAYAVLHTARVS